MRSSMRVTLLCLGAAFRIGFALNPIHESSYNILPSGLYPSQVTLGIGAYVQSQDNSVFHAPVSVALQAGPRVELGAGLKTTWGDDEDHIPYMVFGVKWLALSHTTFQADILVGTGHNEGKGLSFATHHRFQYASSFYSRLAVRIGFMEALVDDDALLAFETAFYPTLVLARSLSLELGIIGSSQTKDFERHLAMDLQPALKVAFARSSFVETAVALGLAGDRKEDLRVKVAVIHGF
jgi:hypothetical protein